MSLVAVAQSGDHAQWVKANSFRPSSKKGTRRPRKGGRLLTDAREARDLDYTVFFDTNPYRIPPQQAVATESNLPPALPTPPVRRPVNRPADSAFDDAGNTPGGRGRGGPATRRSPPRPSLPVRRQLVFPATPSSPPSSYASARSDTFSDEVSSSVGESVGSVSVTAAETQTAPPPTSRTTATQTPAPPPPPPRPPPVLPPPPPRPPPALPPPPPRPPPALPPPPPPPLALPVPPPPLALPAPVPSVVGFPAEWAPLNRAATQTTTTDTQTSAETVTTETQTIDTVSDEMAALAENNRLLSTQLELANQRNQQIQRQYNDSQRSQNELYLTMSQMGNQLEGVVMETNDGINKLIQEVRAVPGRLPSGLPPDLLRRMDESDALVQHLTAELRAASARIEAPPPPPPPAAPVHDVLPPAPPPPSTMRDADTQTVFANARERMSAGGTLRDIREFNRRLVDYKNKRNERAQADVRDAQARIDELQREIEQANGIRAREQTDLMTALVDAYSRVKVLRHEDAERLRLVRDVYKNLSPAQWEQLNALLDPERIAEQQSMLGQMDELLTRYNRQLEGDVPVNRYRGATRKRTGHVPTFTGANNAEASSSGVKTTGMTSLKDAQAAQKQAQQEETKRQRIHGTPHAYLPPIQNAEEDDEEEYFDANDGADDAQEPSNAGGVGTHVASEQAPAGEAGEASGSGLGGDPEGVVTERGEETRNKRAREQEATDGQGDEEASRPQQRPRGTVDQPPRRSERIAANYAQSLEHWRAYYEIDSGSQHFHTYGTRLNADRIRLVNAVDSLSRLTEGTPEYEKAKKKADRLYELVNRGKHRKPKKTK